MLSEKKENHMNNSNIHYRYAISYLVLFIILILALRYYEVPGLVDKLSFALTLSSLLLAILAIFYTIVSAHKQDNQFSKLIETNSELKTTATEIKNVSINLNAALSDLPSHFNKIGHKIDDLANKYMSLSPPEIQSSKDKDGDNPRAVDLPVDKYILQKMIYNLQFDAMSVLYLFSQSSNKGKNAEFSFINSLGIESEYAIGFLNGFETTGLIDFKIYHNAVIPVRCNRILYTELRPILESIISVISEDSAKTLKGRIDKVDTFVA
jgi:hypothetical protein